MFGTYQRLGVSVFTSNLEVIRAARKKLTPGQWSEKKDAIKEFYKMMLEYHKNAQDLYYATCYGYYKD